MPKVLGYTNDYADLRGYAGPARVSSWGPYDGFERGASGLYLPSEVVQGPPPGWPPTAIDLFAGAGGFSLGIHQAGFHVVAALELWSDAALTYLANLGSPATRIYVPDPAIREKFVKDVKKEGKRNPKPRKGWIGVNGEAEAEPFPWQDTELVDHGDFFTWPGAGTGWISHREAEGEREPNTCFEPCLAFFVADAREVTGEQLLAGLNDATGWQMRPGGPHDRTTIDLVVGGPPCQGFSTAGRRNVYDPRNSLVFDFARLCCEMKPKTLCMENVPNMVSMVTPEGELVVDKLCRILEQGGMGIQDNLRQMMETTAGVGVAQRGTPRGREERPEGETRADRRRRLAAERKALKKEAKNGNLVTGDLFSEPAPEPVGAGRGINWDDLKF